jgi:hypothetical protein
VKPRAATLSPQQRVLDALQAKPYSWDELRAATKLSEDSLGLVIGVLLDARKIWTVDQKQSDLRMYGIERRLGLAPRFQEHRRASDLHA